MKNPIAVAYPIIEQNANGSFKAGWRAEVNGQSVFEAWVDHAVASREQAEFIIADTVSVAGRNIARYLNVPLDKVTVVNDDNGRSN